jgi:hypothetical protein
MFSDYRHKALLWLLAITIAITIISGPLWKYWFIVPFTVFVIWVCDAMFSPRNAFMFEPNYNYWKEANEEEY